jgi:hypothetical protein
MSPSDLGQVLKPFVFLDLFDIEKASFRLSARASRGESADSRQPNADSLRRHRQLKWRSE